MDAAGTAQRPRRTAWQADHERPQVLGAAALLLLAAEQRLIETHAPRPDLASLQLRIEALERRGRQLEAIGRQLIARMRKLDELATAFATHSCGEGG